MVRLPEEVDTYIREYLEEVVPQDTFSRRGVILRAMASFDSAVREVVDSESRKTEFFRTCDEQVNLAKGYYYTPRDEYSVEVDVLDYTGREVFGRLKVGLHKDVVLGMIEALLQRIERAQIYTASHDAYGKERRREPVRCDWWGKDYSNE